MERKKYQQLAAAFAAYKNCKQTCNIELQDRWEDRIKEIVDSLPHGSGIDAYTEFNFKKSTSSRLVIDSSYHCMDENGFYDGWHDFYITLTSDWDGLNIQITGYFRPKYRDVKDYLSELFYHDLTQKYAVIPFQKENDSNLTCTA